MPFYRKSLSVLLSWSIFILTFPVPAIAQDKTTLAVLDLEGRGVSALEAASLTDWLAAELVDGGVYQVIERSNVDEILEEQGFQQSGCTTSECAVEVGRMLGVEKMVTGSFGKIGSLYTINIRMFDVTTGAVGKVSKRQHCGEIEGLVEVLALVAADIGGLTPERMPVEIAEVKEKPAIQTTKVPEIKEPEAKKGGKGKLLWLGLGLTAAGGGAYYYMTLQDDTPQESKFPTPPVRP